MENLTLPKFSWWEFLALSLLLLLFYFALQLLSRVLATGSVRRRVKRLAKRAVTDLLALYEPLAILLLCGVFFFVNPFFHGFLLALAVIAGWSSIRNYLSGSILRISGALTPGHKLKTGGEKGIIAKTGKLELEIQTQEGLLHIGYARLLATGYTLSAGKEIGGFYRLLITKPQLENQGEPDPLLADLLLSTPYLDENHRPELRPADEAPLTTDARILVREEYHLHELLQLIREWGYTCEVVKEI